MNILFLGTGAADWPLKRPDSYQEFRRQSSAIIDKCLLIDPGPQVLEALDEQGIALESVKYVICTHKHRDHFNEKTLASLAEAGARCVDFSNNSVQVLGKYTVYAYPGNHGTSKGTLHYMITDGDRAVFYGLDGAWLMYEEVQGIKEHCPHLAVLDATLGYVDGDTRVFEHNDLNMVLVMKNALSPYVGAFCISHMARTLHKSHSELCSDMEKHGIITAFDGMNIEI